MSGVELKSVSVYAKRKSPRGLLREKIIKLFFSVFGIITVLFILLIFIFLLKEGYKAFEQIDFKEFVYSDRISIDGNTESIYEWYPTSDDPRYSILPLILGTLLTAIPAVVISAVLGIAVGLYLSEIASSRVREILKPVVELFSGIPTVVIGFFMLAVGATFFQELFQPANRLNAFLASVGLSFIVIPTIASLTEDALRAIPDELRIASYALGASKWQTLMRVILPASVTGLSAAIILGFGRAISETMIVLMASGNAAELSLSLFKSVRTMTATIAAEMGEVSQNSNHYYALFFIGLILFLATFILNLIAEVILHKMKRRVKL